MMKMCSRIRVLSRQLWIICLTIMVILVTCEANVPSRRSFKASHHMASAVWGTAADAMHLFVNDVQPPIRHAKYPKLDRLMKERLSISVSDHAASNDEVGGHVYDRSAASIIGTTTSNYEKSTVKRDAQRSDEVGIKMKHPFKESKENENTSGEVWRTEIEEPESRKIPVPYVEKSSRSLQYRKRPSAENEVELKAVAYYHKMKNEARCQVPLSVVVHVKDEFPNTDPDWLVSYTPSCIRLHRCSNLSGCCYSPIRQCSAITTENVQLPFKISVTGRNGTKARHEYLTFKNHTKCACELIDSGEKMQQDANYLPTTSIYDSSSESSNYISWNNECHCPYPFSNRVLPDGTCICDCFDKEKECLKIKRGVEHLAQDQRKCIESGKCSLPMCEHGMYELTRGKCPKNYRAG